MSGCRDTGDAAFELFHVALLSHWRPLPGLLQQLAVVTGSLALHFPLWDPMWNVPLI